MVSVRIASAVIASALIVTTAFSGISSGGEGGIEAPETLVLRAYGCLTNDDDPRTACHVYQLEDESGHPTGEISRFRTPIFDLEGNQVGREFRGCTYSKGSQSICTTVLILRDTSNTDRGRIVLTGLPGQPIPITGGSGAYRSVGGEGVAAPDHGSWMVTLELTR